VSWQLRDLKVLDDWLATNPPTDIRTRVLAWLFELAEDPYAVDPMTVPVLMGLPLFTAIVPGTPIAVTYAVVKSPPYPESVAGVHLRRIERTY
jgi:hypothetical protein